MNTQVNTQNPQVQQKIEEARLLGEILNRAGLNDQHPEHGKIAQQAVQDLMALQDPTKEKELKAQMQAFGMQPEEIERNAQALQARFTQLQQEAQKLDQQGKGLVEQGNALGEKLQKKQGMSRIIGFVAAAVAGVGTFFTKMGGEKKKFSGKKVAVAAGLAALAGLAGTLISSMISTKPVMKEGEALQQQAQEIDTKMQQANAQLQQTGQQMQQFNEQIFIEMAARMTKERAAKTDEIAAHQTPPQEQAAPVAAPAAVAATTPPAGGFVAQHANTQNSQQEILTQGAGTTATSPEAVKQSQIAAAATTNQMG